MLNSTVTATYRDSPLIPPLLNVQCEYTLHRIRVCLRRGRRSCGPAEEATAPTPTPDGGPGSGPG